MIKVAHLITGLSIGGAEMMLYKLVAQMDRARFQNMVISLTDEGTLGGSISALGIPVYMLGLRRGVPHPKGLWRLCRLLRRERPQVLQTWLYHSDVLGWLAGRCARVAAIAWNLRCSDMDMRLYSRLSAAVIRVAVFLSAFPDVVIVNSEAGRRWHEKLGYRPRRWRLIPNGFDLERFRPDATAGKRLRQELGLPSDVLLIGLIARYDPMKDHTNFLKAAGLLVKRRSDVYFVLAGHGIDSSNRQLMDALRRAGLERQVYLLGERDDMPSLLAGLDLVVSSSSSEGFPNVIGEAMACGVPCVVTDAGDSAQIVGETGQVVPPQNPQALAAAIGRLMEMGAGGRSQLGAAARRRIEEHYALAAIVARYEALYMELVTPQANGATLA